MISAILTPVCSFTWAFLSWPCRSAWGTKRYKPPWSYMAICTRTCMVMWPSSFRTVPPLICLRQHGKMHKKAYNFGMWYTSGTLGQNKSPESQYLQGFPGFLQLFELNRSRWLSSAIIKHSVHMLHFINNSACHFSKYFPRDLGCFGSHEVDGVYGS